AFLYSRAWQGAVVRSGYNTFHENLLGGVPSLFVPDDSPEMDNQVARAMWARERGCAGLLRSGDGEGPLRAALDRLASGDWRAQAREACQALLVRGERWRNGAVAIAALLDAM